jgi:hypothetical protein
LRVSRRRTVAGGATAAIAAVVAVSLVAGQLAPAVPESIESPTGAVGALQRSPVGLTSKGQACFLGAGAQSVEGAGGSPASSLLGSEPGGEGLAILLAKKLAEGAFDFGEHESLGWVLSLVTGEKGSGASEKEIQSQLDDVQSSLGELSADITELQHSITDLETLVKNETAIQTYEEEANHLSQNSITTIITMQQAYDGIVAARHNKPGNGPLTKTDGDHLAQMREQLPTAINSIYQALDNASQHGAMIKQWNDIVWAGLGYPTSQTLRGTIYTSTQLNRVYNQVDYYYAWIVRALQLYAEAMHTSFTTSSGATYDTDGTGTYVDNEASCVAQILVDFDTDASHGIGPIPDGTMVDLRTNLMWTTAPLTAVDGQPEYACAPGRPYCFADDYDPSGAVINTKAVPNHDVSTGHASDIGGYTDWRVPTTADWASLWNGTDTSKGLTTWAAAQGLDMLRPTTTTAFGPHSISQGVPVMTPLLVNTATPEDPTYGVLSSADPAHATSLTTEPRSADGLQAGQIVAVRPFTKRSPSVQAVPIPSAQSKPSAATHRGAASLGAAGTQTVTFTQASTCAQNTYQIPDDADALAVTVVGGNGGDAQHVKATDQSTPGIEPGGRGGTVTTLLPAVPGGTLYVQVGGNGAPGNGGAGHGGVGGGGNAGQSSGAGKDHNANAGGGGGASGISTAPECGHWLVVAGGGGGAGASAASHYGYALGGRGGDGGAQGIGQSAERGQDWPAVNYTAGRPGTSYPAPPAYAGDGSKGGVAGVWSGLNPTAGADGTLMQGGAGGDYDAHGHHGTDSGGGGGGGGGGGYRAGGGGGAGAAAPGGGGAGGASFVADTSAWAIPASTHYGVSGGQPSVSITPVTALTLGKNDATGQPSGQLLEVNGAGADNGTVVDTWQYTSQHAVAAPNQTWLYVPDRAGEYGQLRSLGSGKCLEPSPNGKSVVQWDCVEGDPNQQWKIADNDSAQAVQLQATGQYLGTATEAGAPVIGGNGTQLSLQSTPSDHTTWTGARAQLTPARSWTFAKTDEHGDTTDQLLEVAGGAFANGATTDTWQRTNTTSGVQANQVWNYLPDGDSGYGQLRNSATGGCLEVDGRTGQPDQWACTRGAENQLWRIVTNDDGTQSLEVRSDHRYLATVSAADAPVSSGNGNTLTTQSGSDAYSSWSATQQ